MIEPLWLALTVPVLIPKERVVEFAATVTTAGTVSPDKPLLLKFTTAPPEPAAIDSVTVQVPRAFAPKVVGLHCSDEIALGTVTKSSCVDTDVPLYVAVTFAV